MDLTVNTADMRTIDEAAALVGKTRLTIYRWLKDAKIAAIVIGGKTFIPQSEIDRILKNDTPLTQAMNKGEV